MNLEELEKTKNKAKRQDWACPREALITDNNVKARSATNELMIIEVSLY
ncbi:hypothetical protein VEE23_32760 [Escherichia coli]|nr:hypothetical protein VEE23_32760 [Escherichia coli]